MHRRLLLYGICCMVCMAPVGWQALAQYYLTGTTLLTEKKAAPHIKMRLHSSGLMFSSGATGDFGVSSRHPTDTLTCWADDYDTLTIAVHSGRQNMIWMQEKAHVAKLRAERGRLSNLTPQLKIPEEHYYSRSGETYTVLVENQVVPTRQHPATGISPHSNKAAYANLRRFITHGQVVPPHAVRTEELINYFSLAIAPQPRPNALFSIASALTDCPWNEAHHLLHINARARHMDFKDIPPANLVFLIDNSGSMDMPNRLPLLKSAFGMLIDALRPQDRVAIVTYGGMAGIWLPPTMGSQKDTLRKYINELEAGGATAGSGGIQLAYELATALPMPGANNRVILATDGDFNVGVTAEKELEDLIIRYRKSGVKLTCLGVGMGNLKDSKIEALARHGHGNYAYLDTEQEAEKVLVNELSENLYSIATNTTMYVALDPVQVQAYKLIGYENRKGALLEEQARLIGGDIGAGFSLNLLVEVQLAQPPGQLQGPIGNFTLRYTQPGIAHEDSVVTPLPPDYQPLPHAAHATRVAAGLAFFSQVLRKAQAVEQFNMSHAAAYCTQHIVPQNPQEEELMALIKKATELYPGTAPGGKKPKAKSKKG